MRVPPCSVVCAQTGRGGGGRTAARPRSSRARGHQATAPRLGAPSPCTLHGARLKATGLGQRRSGGRSVRTSPTIQQSSQPVSTEPGAAQSEPVIALVAAVGTGIGMVGDQVATQLDEYDYRTHVLRLSDYLAEQAEPTFRGKPFDEELWEAMTAGNRLQQAWVACTPVAR